MFECQPSHFANKHLKSSLGQFQVTDTILRCQALPLANRHDKGSLGQFGVIGHILGCQHWSLTIGIENSRLGPFAAMKPILGCQPDTHEKTLWDYLGWWTQFYSSNHFSLKIWLENGIVGTRILGPSSQMVQTAFLMLICKVVPTCYSRTHSQRLIP